MKISKIELENVKCFSKEILSLTKEETEEPLSMCAPLLLLGIIC